MAAYEYFTSKINEKYDINLDFYKESQMKRRLTSLRNKRGFHDFTSYYQAIIKDSGLLTELMDRITFNVTEFYRNPKRWDVLSEKVIPMLIKGKKDLTIWSAACSTGEEPYSLLMMLNEHYSHISAKIIATDLDENVLAHAKQGIYPTQALKDVRQGKKSKYFTNKDGKYYVHNDLKGNITFKKHNLLKDP